MILHDVKVHPSKDNLKREDQLAWKIAAAAADRVPVERDVAAMIINRIIDNAAVAIGAINRHPVVAARDMALGHPRKDAATVFGVAAGKRVSPEWAAWANGTAVRELDMHDTFLAQDYSHPGDNIPPILAVAQTMGKSGRDLIRGIATGYEIHIDLVRAISLHKHKIDHITHLCPGQAAGIGTLLGLKHGGDLPGGAAGGARQLHHAPVAQGRDQLVEGVCAGARRQACGRGGGSRDARRRRAEPDLRRRGLRLIAWLLDGPQAHYQVPLPAPGEPKRAILDSFTKEHSAEYQSQALIDLAFRMREQIADLEKIEKIIIHTSHHTHAVIGTGANDPQKMDPKASRETLDHSIMYIFAVALQDGRWHHVNSYAPRRAGRADTVRLWHKIETREDPEWERRYLSTDPAELAFGGRVEVVMQDGSRIVDELAVANAHPLGAKPFGRDDYIRKFTTLTDGVISTREANRFLEAAQNLPTLKAGELHPLNVALPAGTLAVGKAGDILRSLQVAMAGLVPAVKSWHRAAADRPAQGRP